MSRTYRIWWHLIYYFGAVLWAVVIAVMFFNQLEQLKASQRMNSVNNAPMSDWVDYISITTTKEVFEVWEPIEIRSERLVTKQTPLQFHDILFCDLMDGNGKKRIWENFSSNPAPRQWNYITPPRALEVDPPIQRAMCCVQSTISIQPVIGAEVKYETLESPVFYIWEK